jgi:hypothetical protein
MSAAEKIIEFNLGPNLQSIGISKWVFDTNNNEYTLSFNNNGNGPIIVQRDEAIRTLDRCPAVATVFRDLFFYPFQ